jgi:cytochrome c heme-lyase
MFYNALARKGKLSDTQEDDMDNVVAMHNNMNEKTWRKILQWEDVAGQAGVKLLKFQGRPTDLSPKALFKSKVLGHPLPFDRHDWVILRDDNTTIRYVIDYYYDESRARDSPESAMPPLTDDEATPSLLVDVRPALDGPSQLYERLVAMPMARRVFQSTPFEPLPMLPSTSMKAQVSESVRVWQQIQAGAKSSKAKPSSDSLEQDLSITERQARELARQFAAIRANCAIQEKSLANCNDNCDRASLDWTLCAAPILCALQHEAFRKAVEGGSEAQISSALESVTACVGYQASLRKAAKSKYPKSFQDVSR